MENKEANDDIEIVNVTYKPLTGVQLQIQLYKILEKYSKEVPTERDAFIKFVKSKLTSYDDQIIHNVWKQVRRLSSQNLDCSEPIELSDEEVEKNDKTEKITVNVVNLDVKEENSEEKKYIKVKSMENLIQPISESVNVKPADRSKRKSNGDQPKKRKSIESKNNPKIDLLHLEAEDLRRQLFVDKLIEVAMPSVLNKKKLKK